VKIRTYVFFALFISLVLFAGCSHQAATPAQSSNKQSAASSNSSSRGLVDINSASKPELEDLQEIGEAYAQKIIDHRPYRQKDDLVRLKIIPDSTYQAISDKIIAHQK